MPFRMNCPACNTPNNITDDKRGRKVRCRQCEKVFSVPEANGKKQRADEDAIQENRKGKAANVRKRGADEETDDDDRPAKKKKTTPAKSGSGMMLAVGGVAALLLFCLVGAGGIGAYVFVFRAKPAGDANQLAKVDDKKGEEKKAEAVQKGPPEKKDDVVEPKTDPVVAPDAGKPAPAQLPAELMAQAKKATVYLHVTMPSGVTAEGSGFFAIERGIVITNAHVLGMLLESSKMPKKVDVVQDSGLPTETKMVGEVLGVDRVSDLAVVRVADNGKLPAPLLLANDAPAELQKVYVFGFPFGERLGKNITISEQAISSLRPDNAGTLEKIQLNGGMNPGNSGGPVVNTRGSLVGVSVSIISGAQISFAVPAEKVRRVMDGRVVDHQHGEAYRERAQVRMPVRLTCLDPLNKIREMRVEVWTGPPGNVRPRTNQKPAPLPGDGPRQEHAVNYANGVGTVDVPLPSLPGGHVYWVQPVLSSAKGIHWGAAQPTGADFAVLERKPANLTIDLEKQKERSTKLDSRLTFTTTIGKREEKEVIHATAETLEVLQEPVMKDGKKTATIRTAYGPVNVGVVVNGKTINFSRDELDAMAIVRGMPPTFVIDDTNKTVSFITVTLNTKSPKYYLKDLVQTLNNLVQNPFEATQFQMPNRVVQPQEKFESRSTMAMRARSQQAAPAKTKGPSKAPSLPPPPTIVDLKMNLTFQGVRIRNGREEAVLSVVGTLESRKIKGRSLGDISGKIGFDTAGGFVSFAKVKIFAESEETIPGLGTFRDSQAQDIELDRSAGNLKNLALREAPPPPPKKDAPPIANPGAGVAVGGATKILGGANNPEFKDEAPAGALLVGFEVGLGKFGKNDNIKAIRPIYRNAKQEEIKGKQIGTKLDRVVTVKAKPGYAVGAVSVRAGLWLDAISVTFMRVAGGKLVPADAYSSELFGNPTGNRITLGGDGTPIIGIVGKSNPFDCTGIGLLLKQDAKQGANPRGAGRDANAAAPALPASLAPPCSLDCNIQREPCTANRNGDAVVSRFGAGSRFWPEGT